MRIFFRRAARVRKWAETGGPVQRACMKPSAPIGSRLQVFNLSLLAPRAIKIVRPPRGDSWLQLLRGFAGFSMLPHIFQFQAAKCRSVRTGQETRPTLAACCGFYVMGRFQSVTKPQAKGSVISAQRTPLLGRSETCVIGARQAHVAANRR
jgi:hypothetical protein